MVDLVAAAPAEKPILLPLELNEKLKSGNLRQAAEEEIVDLNLNETTILRDLVKLNDYRKALLSGEQIQALDAKGNYQKARLINYRDQFEETARQIIILVKEEDYQRELEAAQAKAPASAKPIPPAPKNETLPAPTPARREATLGKENIVVEAANGQTLVFGSSPSELNPDYQTRLVEVTSLPTSNTIGIVIEQGNIFPWSKDAGIEAVLRYKKLAMPNSRPIELALSNTPSFGGEKMAAFNNYADYRTMEILISRNGDKVTHRISVAGLLEDYDENLEGLKFVVSEVTG